MGWNFGGAVIQFDYRAVAHELEERAQLRLPGLTAVEAASKDCIDAGAVALDDLGVAANPADAPADFAWVTSRDFDDVGCVVVPGRTVLVARDLGLGQGEPARIAAACATSARRGEVLLFWINDASGTYQLSVFRDGRRVRCWSAGEGMADDEGAALEAEAGQVHGGARVQAVLAAACGSARLEEATFEVFAVA
jgi:hypothetical protein